MHTKINLKCSLQQNFGMNRLHREFKNTETSLAQMHEESHNAGGHLHRRTESLTTLEVACTDARGVSQR